MVTLSVGLEARPEGGLTLTLTLANRGLFAVETYPRLATWSARSGWVGPTFRLKDAVEVRSYYGPPGHPPVGSVFDGFAEKMKPGKTQVVRRNACLLPRGALKLDDPNGMDALERLALPECAVLVLDHTPEELTGEFPRPSVIVPFRASGRLTLEITYCQFANAFFTPKNAFETGTATVAIDVP